MRPRADAAGGYSDSSFWGVKLGRDEVLSHSRIAEFWEVVDYVLLTHPDVHAHIYGHEPGPASTG